MADSDWSDSEDLSDEDLDIHDRIKKLKQSVLETSSMLESINQALINQGNPREVLFPKELQKFRPQPGIRINGQLSFRGEQMAAEYFDFLDEDRDGKVSFSDVRAALSLADTKYGFVHQDMYRYWDSWRMQLADEGVTTDDQGFISREEFVKMRKVVEPRQPLVHELTKAQLGFLPRVQVMWRRLQMRINEAVGGRDDDPHDSRDLDYLDLEEMSYVCVSAGKVYSKAELMQGMIVRARLEKCLQQLKRKVFKKDYVEDPDKYRSQLLNHGLPPPEDDVSRDDIGKADMRRCKPHNFLAWLHSDGPKPTLPALHQFFLWLKYTSYRYIRNSRTLGGFMWDLSLYIKERDLYKDFISIEPVVIDRKAKKKDKGHKSGLMSSLKPKDDKKKKGRKDKAPTEAELRAEEERKKKQAKKAAMDKAKVKAKADLNVRGVSMFTVECGDVGEIGEDGTGVSIKVSALEKMEAFLGARNLPKDCGLMIIFELLIRDGASDQAVEKAVQDCKLVMMRNLDAELSRSDYYKGMYWVPGLSESDGARVVRLALGYRRNVSIDSLLKQAKVPYSTTELFPEIGLEFHMNTHFLDVLNASPSVTVDSLLAFKLHAALEMRRETIIGLLKRTAMAFASGVARRTVNETVEAQEKAAAEAAKRASSDSVGGDSVDMATLFVDRWSHLRGIFPKCTAFLKSCYSWLTGTDNVVYSLSFEKVSDLLAHLGYTNSWMKQHFPTSLGSEPGAVPKLFYEKSKKLKNAIMERFQHVQNWLDEAVAKEEKRQYDLRWGVNVKKKKKPVKKVDEYGNPIESDPESEEDELDMNGVDKEGFAVGGQGRPMTADEGKKEKKLSKAEQKKLDEEEAERAHKAKEEAILGRLKRLGVQVQEEDLFVDFDEGKSPNEVAAEEREVETKAVMAMLQAYERLWEVVVGVHLVDVVAGKTRLTAKLDGMDLMELMPKPPSVLEAKQRQKEQLEEIKARYTGKRRKKPEDEANTEKKSD